jgi:outer membrane protein assembly factor BamB
MTLPRAAGAEPAPDSELYWPQWRGPAATGVAPHGEPPLSWSETENVRWKVRVPGRGHGSPVVWANRVFLLTSLPATPGAEGDSDDGVTPSGPRRFTVLAIDRGTGGTLWEREAVAQVPHEGTHPDGSWAPASAATDGEVVVAHFGSRGLYVYDLDGDLLWSKDLGDMTTRRGFGEGSSPVLAGDVLVVNWDHEGSSFIVAFDKKSGNELWRQERDEVTSWATPLVVEAAGRLQVVVNATERVRSYDLETGKPVWEAGGQTVNVIPSPVHRNGLVYATSGFRGSALKAIRLAGASGDLTGTDAVVWSYDRDTPYVPSPLLYGDRLYFLKSNSGIVTSLNAETGELLFGPERLDGIEGVYASPVGAADRVYIVGRGGDTVVLRHGDAFEVLAVNTLDDDFSASPAIAGAEMFLRGAEHLYCLAEDAEVSGAD